LKKHPENDGNEDKGEEDRDLRKNQGREGNGT
jgi:hypothetical protein